MLNFSDFSKIGQMLYTVLIILLAIVVGIKAPPLVEAGVSSPALSCTTLPLT